jgi:hypothetical protein
LPDTIGAIDSIVKETSEYLLHNAQSLQALQSCVVCQEVPEVSGKTRLLFKVVISPHQAPIDWISTSFDENGNWEGEVVAETTFRAGTIIGPVLVGKILHRDSAPFRVEPDGKYHVDDHRHLYLRDRHGFGHVVALSSPTAEHPATLQNFFSSFGIGTQLVPRGMREAGNASIDQLGYLVAEKDTAQGEKFLSQN